MAAYQVAQLRLCSMDQRPCSSSTTPVAHDWHRQYQHQKEACDLAWIPPTTDRPAGEEDPGTPPATSVERPSAGVPRQAAEAQDDPGQPRLDAEGGTPLSVVPVSAEDERCR